MRGGDAEHLAHAGAADRAFAADDDDVAGLDRAVGDRVETGLLAFEDLGRAFEAQFAVAGQFHHAAFGREIAVADAEAAALLDRRVGADDHFLARGFRRASK